MGVELCVWVGVGGGVGGKMCKSCVNTESSNSLVSVVFLVYTLVYTFPIHTVKPPLKQVVASYQQKL